MQRRRVLAVGVGYAREPEQSGLPRLPAAPKDAKRIADAFGAGFDADLMTSITAGVVHANDLEHRIQSHFSDRTLDLAVFTYSGHAVQDGSTTYFATDKENKDDAGLVGFDVLRTAVRKSSAPCLLILDCCHAGSLYEGRKIPRNVVMIGACAHNQLAESNDDSSAFARVVVECLDAARASGEPLSAAGLFDRIQRAFPTSISQNPVYVEQAGPVFRRFELFPDEPLAPATALSQSRSRPSLSFVSPSEDPRAVEIASGSFARTFPLAGMVQVPAGAMTMGTGAGAREVQFHRPFLMGITPVTQAEYEAVLKTNPSEYETVLETNPSEFVGDQRPVDSVSWLDAIWFCNRMSELAGVPGAYELVGRAVSRIPESLGFRLPTEAEWEYACRGGTTGVAAQTQDAWLKNNGGGRTHDVKELAPNGLGLHDMLGNVWEWCEDWFGSQFPTGSGGPDVGRDRVVRGGSWSDFAVLATPTSRSHNHPASKDNNNGFRIVRST